MTAEEKKHRDALQKKSGQWSCCTTPILSTPVYMRNSLIMHRYIVIVQLANTSDELPPGATPAASSPKKPKSTRVGLLPWIYSKLVRKVNPHLKVVTAQRPKTSLFGKLQGVCAVVWVMSVRVWSG